MDGGEDMAKCNFCIVLVGVQIHTPTEQDHVVISLN